jgi:hypothetical protein
MPDFVTQPTATAQWYALVNEAELAAGCQLKEALESYLVYLLMRFARHSDMVSKTLAIEYLQALTAPPKLRHNQLREVGDHCLLYSGLFPKRAERLRLKLSYFVDLGRSAYHALATADHELADVYSDLCQEFVATMSVLQATRQVGKRRELFATVH